MKTLTIASRFCGPSNSSNGGYFAGVVATLASRTLQVRLLKPPPLNVELTVRELADGALQVLRGEEAIGSARPGVLKLDAPPAPEYLEAVEASRRYAGFRHHRFPSCFVCGTHRVRGDGLRIFAGPIPGRAVVAAPWVPDASLDGGGGKVRPEFMSAALDCPGYYAVAPDDRMMLLAEFIAHVDRLVHIGESCTLIGWQIGTSGRKREAGTAIFDGKGQLCGRARALWIEPRSAAAVSELPTPAK
ncbi:MAG TPA: hypothetical protein VGZ05_00805 [Steroidobacteraceae bacterium]|jgi:hypothetical protein|nr:hypothetical protein [Steroidobacteraceae bacterium]